MTYRRSILRGYDKETEGMIARALHIPLNKESKHKGGNKMKIPMSMLKKAAKDAKYPKKGGKGKLSSLKKLAKNDKDGDE